MKEKSKKGEGTRTVSFEVALEGRKPEDDVPRLTAIAVDANGETVGRADAGPEGKFELPAGAFDAAVKVLIGAAGAEPGEGQELVALHKHQVARAIESEAAIDLSLRTWQRFLRIRVCVEGRARHCQWRPFVAEVANTRITRAAELELVGVSDRPFAQEVLLEPVLPFWKRCRPLCDGVVDVYRRTCCCPPFVVYDPRIPVIIRELEVIERKDPPFGPPDPGPLRFADVKFLTGGTADERAIHASTDLLAIRRLAPAEQAAYIQARRYLFCSCGSPHRLASGFLQPDGSFNVCWWESIRLQWRNCHDEYAFVVRQLVGDATVVIYDGVAAGQWFDADEEITLTSYHPDAILCDEPQDPPPGMTGTSVMLEAINATESLHLDSPLPTGWDRVPAPTGTHGLAFPGPLASPAVDWHNVGWGETLPLRYLFYNDLQPIARYYRVSMVKCDAGGAPTGTRHYFDTPLSWTWLRRRIDLSIVRESAPLGPVGDRLYRIPYPSLFQGLLAPGEIGEWSFLQFHAEVDTTDFDPGRHLVTLELFDAAQQQIKPATAPAGDPGNPAGFSFQTWDQSNLSATVPVHHGGLTHLFWWDNRSTEARIEAVRKGGATFDSECLFLEGPRNTTVSIDYVANHEEPLFLYWHDLQWKRGLFTPWETWVAPTAAVANPATSPTKTYDVLLGPANDKCSFTVEVQTAAKITNGSGRVAAYDHRDDGSFAIISPRP